MPEYDQSSGSMTNDGRTVGEGYSGRGTSRNRPEAERLRDLGPIPHGRYIIEYIGNYPGRGPVVFRLRPTAETNTYGRDGFLIHGDNPANDASQGCIILPRAAREQLIDIVNQGDNILIVR